MARTKVNTADAGKEVEGGAEMDMTPMIDITFQLIIFFLVANDLTRKETGDLELPKAIYGEEDKATEKDPRIIINILKETCGINHLMHTTHMTQKKPAVVPARIHSFKCGIHIITRIKIIVHIPIRHLLTKYFITIKTHAAQSVPLLIQTYICGYYIYIVPVGKTRCIIRTVFHPRQLIPAEPILVKDCIAIGYEVPF